MKRNNHTKTNNNDNNINNVKNTNNANNANNVNNANNACNTDNGSYSRLLRFLPFFIFHILICIFDIFAQNFNKGSGISFYENGYRVIFELSFIIMLALSAKANRIMKKKHCRVAPLSVQAVVFLIYCEIFISVLMLLHF